MKTCPVCESKMPVNETDCPDCGANYLSSVVGDIISSSGNDSELGLKLDNLEEGLSGLETLPEPTLGDTARRLMPVLSIVAALFFLLSGVLTRVPVFYILAILQLIPAIMGLIAKFSGRKRLCNGEMLLHAAARIFNEDSAAIREQYGDQSGVAERIDAMQARLNEAFARIEAAHKRNIGKVFIIAGVVVLICGAGVGAIAVKKSAIRKAEAEYAMQPEWVKLRDLYMERPASDESGRKALRESTVSAMLGAGQSATAELFFFEQCQGNIGDIDCAMAIARYYKEQGDSAALQNFIKNVSLRYDSDTRKIKSFK